MATTSLQRRVRLGGRLRPGRGLRARSRFRVGSHALAQRMLEGLLYLALLLLLLLLVLFLILLFIFLFLVCANRLSTRQSKLDSRRMATTSLQRRVRFRRKITIRKRIKSTIKMKSRTPCTRPKNAGRPALPRAPAPALALSPLPDLTLHLSLSLMREPLANPPSEDCRPPGPRGRGPDLGLVLLPQPTPR